MPRYFDVIVIGGGSGGFAAARTAGRQGARVGLIERGPYGGLCILRGCMPSKAFLRTSEVLHLIRDSAKLGLQVDPLIGIDWQQIRTRKQALIKEFAAYRIEQMRTAPNVTIIDGDARFLDPHVIEVQGDHYQADSFIIATGSKPLVPLLPGLADAGYITSDEAMDLPQLPRSLVVLGGGAIAVELGQFFHRLAVPTVFLQRSAHLLSHEDSDVGRALTEYFRQEGMTVHTGVTLERVETEGGRKIVHYRRRAEPATVGAEAIMVAMGRDADLDRLNLEAAGVASKPKGIRVDLEMRTNVRHIFAVGDCTPEFQVVHMAIYQGEIAAHNALHPDQPHQADYRTAAWAVFCDPNFGRVGLSERDAQQAGIPYRVATYPFSEHGKALCMGRPEGFVKVLADPQSGEILGAQVLGAEGSDLIHELIVAMHARMTVKDLTALPHLHPTLAEIWTNPAEALMDQGAPRTAAHS